MGGTLCFYYIRVFYVFAQQVFLILLDLKLLITSPASYHSFSILTEATLEKKK